MTVTLPEPETRNETIMTLYKSCVFSENIFAWFECGMNPVFSDKMEDLMLSDNYVVQQHCFSCGTPNKDVYEIYSWSEKVEEHLYAGRLYAPESYAKVHFSNL